MRANLLEENRRDCKSRISWIDVGCNRKWMRIFNCDLTLIALGVLEGWDRHCLHEIQMDANRWINMRCQVLWMSIVHCNLCFMCTNSVTITKIECDSWDPHARVISRTDDHIVSVLNDPCWQCTYSHVWSVPFWVLIRWDCEWSSLVYVNGTQRGRDWNWELWRSIRDIQREFKGIWRFETAWRRIYGKGNHSDQIESVEGWRYF